LVTHGAEGRSAGRHADGSGLQSKGWRLPAHQIEQVLVKQLTAFLRDRGALPDAFRLKRKSPDFVSALLTRASKLADGCESGSFARYLETVSALVRRVTIAQERVTIEIDHAGLIERLTDQKAPSQSRAKDRQPILIEVPVRFRRRGIEAKLVVLDQQQSTNGPDANLVKALTRAHEWFGRILREEASGIGDIARYEGLCRTYVTRVLCLAFLAPEETKAILEGRQPTELTAKQLISSALNLPLLWPDVRDRRQSGHAQ
jgi:hypothetical protein